MAMIHEPTAFWVFISYRALLEESSSSLNTFQRNLVYLAEFCEGMGHVWLNGRPDHYCRQFEIFHTAMNQLLLRVDIEAFRQTPESKTDLGLEIRVDYEVTGNIYRVRGILRRGILRSE